MVASQLENIISDLNDRNQELSNLYRIDEVLGKIDMPVEDILQDLIAIIPNMWRYPSICRVQISLEEAEVAHPDFIPTDLKLTKEIMVEDRQTGSITVVYIKPVREEKGIFIQREHQFLSAVAKKISSFLLYKQLRKTIDSLQAQNKFTHGVSEDDKLRVFLREQKLTDYEIERMLSVKITFNKGETICKQGAIASYMILLTDGLSKNFLEGNNEKGFNFKIIKPFNFIGLSSLYGNNLYAFSGSALTKCEAYLIESQLFKNIVSSNRDFSKHVMNWYCETTQSHFRRMSSLANKQSLARLCETLLYLEEDIFDGSINTMTVSRKDIAELAAISTESAVRFLSDLNKDGIIKIHHNKIEVKNKSVLKLISTQ